MMSVEQHITLVVKILTIGAIKNFTNRNGKEGSLLVLTGTVNKETVTVKIWNNPVYPEKGNYIKLTELRQVKETYNNTPVLSYHTTTNTEILYPFLPLTDKIERINEKQGQTLSNYEHNLHKLIENIVSMEITLRKELHEIKTILSELKGEKHG